MTRGEEMAVKIFEKIKGGDKVRWDGHEWSVVRLTDETAVIARLAMPGKIEVAEFPRQDFEEGIEAVVVWEEK